jgi:hypothetical protein
MAPTPDEMLAAVSGSLAARTGRSLDEWLAVVRASGIDPLDQAAVRGPRPPARVHAPAPAARAGSSRRAGAAIPCRSC